MQNKQKENENENGRSMIEMLGVLAIIGVLSVGGIAGYSKAMYRYRLNKTIEQITYTAGAVRSFFAPQKNYEGLNGCYNNNDYCTLYRKAKLVMEDMFGDYLHASGFTVQGGVVNPFGGQFDINSTAKIDDGSTGGACSSDPICKSQALHIGVSLIPQEACIDLITQDWSDAGVSMIKVDNFNNPTTDLRHGYLIPPVSIDHAVKICEVSGSNANVTYIGFYFDADVTQGSRATNIDTTRAALDAL